MMKLSLNGAWEFRKCGEPEWTTGTVPGSMYNDLINAGKLEDPFFRDNEASALDLSNYNYEYRRKFYIDEKIINMDKVVLCCKGLDTLAEIFVNEILIAEACNMHRSYEFNIKEFLRAGENTMRIVFKSSVAFIKEKQSERPLWNIPQAIGGISHIRKAHYMFGWDWGLQLPDAGIWRDIAIRGYDIQRLKDIYISQVHEMEEVRLKVKIGIAKTLGIKSNLRVTLIHPDGKETSEQVESNELMESVTLNIDNPRLWWPNGLGSQPLYVVRVELIEDDKIIDSEEYRIGLRTIRINQREDKWGKSYAFEVNGVEIFAMGGNYIPEDHLLARCSRARSEKLIKDCVEANFNMLRVWGGGIYPEDYFFDLCDEYGIIVWQDLMYSCAVYELTEDFKENISAETYDNLRRIRHHASLGLICGNNEMEMGMVDWPFVMATPKLKADYIKQFEVLLQDIVHEVTPDIFYWPSSPSSGGSFDRPNYAEFGDTHDWGIWFGNKPFTNYRKGYPRFVSEFGLQSFPSSKTIENFTIPEDRNPYSYILEKHQRSEDGNSKIMKLISQYFKFPKDFNSFIYLSGLIQAEGVRYGVEHWRRIRGICMGALYWQLNDCCPMISWSSIDYYGRWKALHYAARKFFSPILASAVEEDTGIILSITNDTLNKSAGTLSWKLCDSGSNVIIKSEKEVEINPFTSVECDKLDFTNVLKTYEDKRAHYFAFSFDVNGKIVSSGTVLFVPAKHFKFTDPKLKAEIREEENEFIISIASKGFAKYIELDFKSMDAVFSDNYFDLSCGEIKEIVVEKNRLESGIGIDDLESQLLMRSLFDSYV